MSDQKRTRIPYLLRKGIAQGDAANDQLRSYIGEGAPGNQNIGNALRSVLRGVSRGFARQADMGVLDTPADLLWDLAADAYTDVTFSGTGLLGSAVDGAAATKATNTTSGLSASSADNIVFTSVLPGERSMLATSESPVRGVGKPIKVTITNTDDSLGVTVTEEDEFWLIEVVHGDGVATLEEIIDAINDHATAKYLVDAAIADGGDDGEDATGDTVTYIASALSPATEYNTSGLPTPEMESAGFMPELWVAGVLCDGSTAGFGITSYSATEIVADFDLSDVEAEDVEVVLVVGGVDIFRQRFPLNVPDPVGVTSPYMIDVTVAAEASNRRDVTIQVKDRLGVNVTATQRLLATLLEADMSDTEAANGHLAIQGTGTGVSTTQKPRLLLTTTAAGAAVVRAQDVTDTAITRYLVIERLATDDGDARPCPRRVVTLTFAA